MDTTTMYYGQDPMLRWYADSGAATWAHTVHFGTYGDLNYLGWRETHEGLEYEVIIDRGTDDSLRIVVDLGRLEVPTTTPTPTCRSGRPRHQAGGCSHKGFFYMVGACGDRRLHVAACHFTESQGKVQVARGLARQAIEAAASVRFGDMLHSDSGFFVECGRAPWR